MDSGWGVGDNIRIPTQQISTGLWQFQVCSLKYSLAQWRGYASFQREALNFDREWTASGTNHVIIKLRVRWQGSSELAVLLLFLPRPAPFLPPFPRLYPLSKLLPLRPTFRHASEFLHVLSLRKDDSVRQRRSELNHKHPFTEAIPKLHSSRSPSRFQPSPSVPECPHYRRSLPVSRGKPYPVAPRPSPDGNDPNEQWSRDVSPNGRHGRFCRRRIDHRTRYLPHAFRRRRWKQPARRTRPSCSTTATDLPTDRSQL